MRICFFANMSGHENWPELFDKVEFYRVDIRLLRELGHDVVLAGRPTGLDCKADLFYCWWWGHAPFALALGALLRKPVLVTGAFDYATCREEIPGLCYLDRPFWQKIVLKTILRCADVNLFISKYEYDEVLANLKVRNPILAPLAIDTDFYNPGNAVAQSDYFFAVSWTSKTNAIRKGLPQTIDAFAQVAAEFPAVRLILAGKPGDFLDTLRAQAKKLGVEKKVEFVGMISDEQKRNYYRHCIAYVQPTLYEGFGHAIAEAVSCGAPVVASNRGAVPEVAGRFAQCVEPKDVGAIAAAMAGCIDREKTWAEVHAAHAWVVDHYSMNARRSHLSRILEKWTPDKILV